MTWQELAALMRSEGYSVAAIHSTLTAIGIDVSLRSVYNHLRIFGFKQDWTPDKHTEPATVRQLVLMIRDYYPEQEICRKQPISSYIVGGVFPSEGGIWDLSDVSDPEILGYGDDLDGYSSPSSAGYAVYGSMQSYLRHERESNRAMNEGFVCRNCGCELLDEEIAAGMDYCEDCTDSAVKVRDKGRADGRKKASWDE